MQIWIKGKPRKSWAQEQKLQLYEALGGSYVAVQGPVVLRLRFLFEVPQPRLRGPAVSELSLPALVRASLDILCGVCWENEKQIVGINTSKEYGNVSGIQILF
jgi:hypothetical protein